MKKNYHLHRLIRFCLMISLLLLCSTSQVFAAAKVNVKNTKIKLSATKLTYNQKVQRPKVSVTYKGKVLKEKKNYVLKYSKGCKKVGVVFEVFSFNFPLVLQCSVEDHLE